MQCPDDEYGMVFFEKGEIVDHNTQTKADKDVYVCPHCDQWIYPEEDTK